MPTNEVKTKVTIRADTNFDKTVKDYKLMQEMAFKYGDAVEQSYSDVEKAQEKVSSGTKKVSKQHLQGFKVAENVQKAFVAAAAQEEKAQAKSTSGATKSWKVVANTATKGSKSVSDAATKSWKSASAAATKTAEVQVKGLATLDKGAISPRKSLLSLADIFQRMGKVETGKDYKRAMHGLGGEMQRITAAQMALMHAMEQAEPDSEAYKQLEEQLKMVGEAGAKVQTVMGAMPKIYRDQAKAAKEAEESQGSFSQGMLQGLIPAAAYLKRGPGMAAQAAGAALGSSGRQIIGGAASTPFTGAAGMSQMMAGIPFIGGLMAGKMQAAMGLAGPAMGFQQARLERAPTVMGGAIATASGQSLIPTNTERFKRDLYAPMKRRYGYSRAEMEEMGGALTQSAGHGMATTEVREIMPVAAAAQRAYGVGPEVSGKFAQAAITGGIVGGPAGKEGLLSSLSDAVSLGLEGSDLQDYLRQIAGGFDEWKTTGIALNSKTLGEMSKDFSALGMAGVRAANMAMGMQQAGKTLAEGGPTTPEQLMLLKTAYGFKGGGLGEYNEALMRAQEGKVEKGALWKILGQAEKAGGGTEAGAESVAVSMFGQLGITKSRREVRDLLQNKSMINEEEFTNKYEPTVFSEKGLSATADKMTDLIAPNVKAQAALQDKQIAIGTSMIDTMNKLELASLATTAAFEKSLGPAVAKFATVAEKVAVWFERLMETPADTQQRWRAEILSGVRHAMGIQEIKKVE